MNLFDRPFLAFVVMLGFIYLGVGIWASYSPDIQAAIRTLQNILFWWQ